MKWEKVKLGDIATFSNGINFNKTAYAKGIKLIGVSNFGDRFYPDCSQLQEVKKDIVRLEDCLRNGDIVFVRSNGNKELVGRCMLVKNPTERVTYSGFCIRARLNDTDRYDPVYFTYYFKSKAFRRAVSGTAVGANIQNLSQARLSNHECRIPSIEVQHRIADILSVYDDLIENNQKQIKLLEEAAQRLYKKWFVDLRFPGHENTKIVDGVPEGWHRGTIGQIAEFKRGRTITKAQVKGGNVPVIAGGLEPAYYHNVANTKAPVITISASGANAGFVRLYGVDVFASDCSFVDGLGTESLFFVYEFLKESKVSIDQLQKGSAQPHVYAKDINAMKITIPEKEYLERFDRYAKVYFNKIKTLQGQNERLKTARDLLLPKLMSGEVEV